MPRGIPNSHQRDSHSLEQKGGDDMQSKGQSAERWLTGQQAPELSDLSPDNLFVVHFAHYTTKKVEAELLRLVEGLDVVLVASNEELATVMATRLAVHAESLLLVDFSDTTAREGITLGGG